MIPVSRPLITKDDVEFVKRKALNKSLVAQSDLVFEFEHKIKNYLNIKYAISTCNGSSALISAVAALNLKKKSNILIPNCTIISVLNAVLVNGHKPVFVDIDFYSWNLDYKKLRKEINNKKIHAVILVENYNSSPHMSRICKMLKQKKIKIIEDASESFGGTFMNKKFGTYGDITTLSFFANKIITTGEGGMILSNNKEYYNYFKSHINLFFTKERNFKHSNIGYNFRMNSMSAALGISQFKKINFFLRKRKEIYQNYIEKLNWQKISTQFILPEIKSSYWVMPILNKKINSSKMINFLSKKKIQSRHLFFPLSEQPINKRIKKLKASRFIFDYGIIYL